MNIRIFGYDNAKLYNMNRTLGAITLGSHAVQNLTPKTAYKIGKHMSGGTAGMTAAESITLGVGTGLMELGLRVQRDAQKMTPVFSGNLKGGAFTAPSGTLANPTVTVTFPAEYALYVHEDMEVYHSNGEARFLAKAVAKNYGDSQRVFVKNVGNYVAKGVRGTAYGQAFGSYSGTAGAEAGATGMISGI